MIYWPGITAVLSVAGGPHRYIPLYTIADDTCSLTERPPSPEESSPVSLGAPPRQSEQASSPAGYRVTGRIPPHHGTAARTEWRVNHNQRGIKKHDRPPHLTADVWGALSSPAKGSSTQMHAGKHELSGKDQASAPLGYTQGTPFSSVLSNQTVFSPFPLVSRAVSLLVCLCV